MDEIERVIADALTEEVAFVSRTERVRRILDALANNGFAVVRLPEKVVDRDGFETWPVEQKPWGGTVRKRQTDGRLDFTGVETPFNDPREALSLAAALIAAARYVQEKNGV